MTQPFNFSDGQVANDAKDLLELCKQYPDEATGYLVRQDLEKWLAYIGNYDVAECAANARQTDIEDRQKLEDFLNKCHSLTAPKPVPAAAPETQIEDNLTAPESATTTKTPQATPPDSPPPVAKKSLETATPPEKPAAKTPVGSNSADSEAKPSFFQVVAKFIVRILYRNKA